MGKDKITREPPSGKEQRKTLKKHILEKYLGKFKGITEDEECYLQ